jgi:acetyl esterase/lipase
MFFSDPSKAVGEMLRVTKEGGKIALAVWGKSENNPFSSRVTSVLSRYLPPAPVVAGGHDAFRFAEPGTLAEILKSAGAAAVQDRLLKFRIAAPISIDRFWEMRSETSETLRNKVAQLAPDERTRIAKEVKEEIAVFFAKGVMDFPAEMRIVTGFR